MIQVIKGFKDILPEDSALWQYIENTARTLFEDFGFKEIRLPILERTELFKRSIGEDTDIVEKEMYTFPDRKGDLITLRPEATASVVRSYIQHKMHTTDPVRKLYTIGPMFRRERPQKGRYRQFYQINAEVFGIQSPYIDAQLIFMLMTLFERLALKDITAHINSLGCPACRPQFKAALLSFLKARTDQLCDNCKQRKDRNPLRVLDCKVPACQEATKDAPSIVDTLCPDCRDHFDTVKAGLKKQNVPFTVDKKLVRGLDYYTRTAFEILTTSLGAQNAVAGGGRYDGLTKALGGPDMPAIGFAIGFDRLSEIMAQENKDYQNNPDIFIAALGDNAWENAYHWAGALSLEGIHTEIDFSGKSLKAQMKRANRLNAAHVLIIGENEIKQGAVILRNMETKEQHPIATKNIINNIKAALHNQTGCPESKE